MPKPHLHPHPLPHPHSHPSLSYKEHPQTNESLSSCPPSPSTLFVSARNISVSTPYSPRMHYTPPPPHSMQKRKRRRQYPISRPRIHRQNPNELDTT
ncbi:hypothetical protein L211DRAFT_360796 [Terfezia boudieri ATCC MYA-4762]|uniref:Uncharacterized protein n=1 Tax=Terfezia boudieri ATCC MYA-4762 TaxID=1051890 RepID=A0A3N4LVL5_9PEZI|nr:hypothetical protein L211DRAFT_360796 [Terfezia boudieri ATCC MYA-4762]